MSAEETPLLSPSANVDKEVAKHSDSSEDSSESLSIKLSSYKIPSYGATFTPDVLTKVVPSEERITYTWNELNAFASTKLSNNSIFKYFKRNKITNFEEKHILKNANGVAYPGELLAILGSSGAGKTTLLNALTFRCPKNITITGTRCVNGMSVEAQFLTSKSAYVQQEDLFIGCLTIREHLIFQALLRMDKPLSYKQRMERVEEVINELGLKKCEHTMIGILGRIKGISGGEQKRLSVAAELLTNPALMFCDEPTSGLDSFMAFNVVQLLKNMAMKGKTVICTIHQPSSELYAMFDKLLLMSEGRIAFLGTPDEADIFFTELEAPCPRNYNPADYFIQLLAIVPGHEESCRHATNMICNRFERSEIGVKIAVNTAMVKDNYSDIWINGNGQTSPYKASWCAQFRAVLWRTWLSIIKEPLLIKVRLIQTLVVSILIGLIYFGQNYNQDGVMNINGVLFIFLTNMTFQNLFAVINVFCCELPIFLKENRNGMYRTDVYFIAKTIAEIPFFIFIPVIFTSICYFMIGLNPLPEKFFINLGIMILVTNATTSFGYLISCLASGISMALSVGPPLIIPFLLFGGFFLNINSIPIYFQWVSYLSWFKYGNEALLINQWDNIDRIDCPISNNSTCPKNGHVILEIYNFNEANFGFDLISLLALIIGFRLLAFFALLYKSYRYQ